MSRFRLQKKKFHPNMSSSAISNRIKLFNFFTLRPLKLFNFIKIAFLRFNKTVSLKTFVQVNFISVPMNPSNSLVAICFRLHDKLGQLLFFCFAETGQKRSSSLELLISWNWHKCCIMPWNWCRIFSGGCKLFTWQHCINWVSDIF